MGAQGYALHALRKEANLRHRSFGLSGGRQAEVRRSSL